MFATLLRTLVLYLVIIVGIRAMGKRQIGELEPSELVLSLLIADLACVPMQDPGIPLHAGLLPILALLSASMVLSVLTMKSPALRRLLCGRPSILIRRGSIDQEELRRNRMTLDELLEELRAQGYTNLERIQYAILETNGQLSILPYAAHSPADASQLGIQTAEGGLPTVLISDGRVQEEGLRQRGHNRTWLAQALKRQGCTGAREVFLLSEDELGGLCLVRRQEKGGRGL